MLHPEFEAFCGEIKKRFPREKMALWSSGPKRYQELKPLIDETFGFIAYNEHNEEQLRTCKHQPLTIAIREAVPDAELRRKLVDDCWVQRTWCATVNHFGAYFCEVAAAQDVLLNEGKNAWPVTPDWWVKTPDEFERQVRTFCDNCGMAIPMERELIQNEAEKFSPGLLRVFREKGLRKVDESQVEVFDRQVSREEILVTIGSWKPGNYRGDLHDDEAAPEERGFTGQI